MDYPVDSLFGSIDGRFYKLLHGANEKQIEVIKIRRDYARVASKKYLFIANLLAKNGYAVRNIIQWRDIIRGNIISENPACRISLEIMPPEKAVEIFRIPELDAFNLKLTNGVSDKEHIFASLEELLQSMVGITGINYLMIEGKDTSSSGRVEIEVGNAGLKKPKKFVRLDFKNK